MCGSVYRYLALCTVYSHSQKNYAIRTCISLALTLSTRDLLNTQDCMRVRVPCTGTGTGVPVDLIILIIHSGVKDRAMQGISRY